MSVRKFFGIFLLSFAAVSQVQAATILLTNDDGYQHPWIRALQTALLDAGHNVTVVAPAENQSGKSASLTMEALRGGAGMVENPEPKVYAVKGTPATAALIGVKDILPTRPDLIVSGINEGANIGVLSSFSGTVGATIAALNLMGEPIPAIAISGNLLDPKSEPDSAINLAHAKAISAFVVRLIANLEASRQSDNGVLPKGIALNVNYPAVAEDEVAGVGIYRHGRDIGVDFTGKGVMPVVLGGDKSEYDTTGLREGYITIVPIDGDYTAPNWQQVLPGNILEGLH